MITKKRSFRTILIFLLILPMLLVSAACGNNGGSAKSGGGHYSGTITFGDSKFSSIEVHTWIARTILEKGYGYKTDVKSGSSASTMLGMERGDIDAMMEIWQLSLGDVYTKAVKSGKVKKVSINYADDKQGLYVPTYMIKGDPKRGIKATAPDLKSVKDLKKYWKLFKDPSDPSKGRIIGSPTGWEADKSLKMKMKTYNLDKKFNYFNPGSQTALSTSLVKAYKAGKPWVGYYWTPTWIMGKYDMTLLKEPAYNAKTWKKNRGCAFPKDKVAVVVNSKFAKKAPRVVKFLSHYKTSAKLTNQALAYMQSHNVKPKQAALWWMKKNPDVWTKWVPNNVAKKVKKAIS